MFVCQQSVTSFCLKLLHKAQIHQRTDDADAHRIFLYPAWAPKHRSRRLEFTFKNTYFRLTHTHTRLCGGAVLLLVTFRSRTSSWGTKGAVIREEAERAAGCKDANKPGINLNITALFLRAQKPVYNQNTATCCQLLCSLWCCVAQRFVHTVLWVYWRWTETQSWMSGSCGWIVMDMTKTVTAGVDCQSGALEDTCIKSSGCQGVHQGVSCDIRASAFVGIKQSLVVEACSVQH